jgi:hypothetical protein
MQYDGLRFRAECRLAGKVYGQPFGVDVGFGDPIFGEPDVVVADDVLAFAGIAPPTLRLYPALKVERGVQMDETLNSLLRAEPTLAVLGPAHCKLAEYVLCDPELGWNVRNEIAHGTIHADALTPTRVLLAWLLVVRLTCFVATPSGETSPPAAPGDAVPEAVQSSGDGATPGQDQPATEPGGPKGDA